MPDASPEQVGQELSDLAFGIIEQNWLELHIGKVVDLKTIENLDAAEWELTYLILFAITQGCATFASTDPARTTGVLKAFHGLFLRHIADQAGREIADAHQQNLPARYRLYGDAVKGEGKTGRYTLLGEAAAIQILGKSIDDSQTADNFRETMKVIFSEVSDSAFRTMH
ncbi:MAG TPA: hypothetical protein VGJ57_06655 [Nitrospirales bacterium]|jgi:hypothetical protein